MTTHEAVVAVVQLVTEQDHVSVAQVQRLLEDRMPVHGDEMVGRPDLNLWCAFGLSTELADVLQAVQLDGRVTLVPTDLLVYLADGCALPMDMPLAKRVPANGYRKPHWSPVVFRLRDRVRHLPGYRELRLEDESV